VKVEEPKKVEEVVEKKEEPKEVAQTGFRFLKKKYSNNTMKKAQVVSEILGGNPEDYYGLADAYCLSSSNELIEIILNSTEDILSKYPSYKD
jgi:hypothetical protein